MVTDTLMDNYDIYVQPINYPTVPRGTERMRLTATAAHSEEDIRALVSALDEMWKSNHALRALAA
jgi:5-aminolevulinate synthase